jgi:hypothetical protein
VALAEKIAGTRGKKTGVCSSAFEVPDRFVATNVLCVSMTPWVDVEVRDQLMENREGPSVLPIFPA